MARSTARKMIRGRALGLAIVNRGFLPIHAADLSLQRGELLFGLANLDFRSLLRGPGLLQFLPGALSVPWIDLGL